VSPPTQVWIGRGRRAGSALVFLFGLLLSRGAAAAPDPTAAEPLIQRGVELRRAGNEKDALPLFQQAYELTPRPRTAALLGLVEMALDNNVDAERHLTEALAAHHDPWVIKNRPVLTDSLRTVRASMGELIINGRAGAEVLVNGKFVGQLPLLAPVRLAEGSHTIEVRDAAYHPGRRSVAIRAGQRQEVTIELQSASSPALISSAPPEPPRLLPRSPSADDEPPTSRARSAAWVTAVGALATAGFGVYETMIWFQRRTDFENHIGPRADDVSSVGLNCGVGEPGHGGPGCFALYESMTRAQTLAIVGYATAGVLTVGSIVLFSTSSASKKRDRPVLSCAPRFDGGAGCQLSMVF
jgi:hypothetical protein